jgi:L-alanine-DL-glutamate epimerase-like enolase superfamily enzyme
VAAVSAGEQSYTPAAVADLILAGVPRVQPDIVKMGGITAMLRCAALAQAHGAEFVPHQTQPTIGHMASLRLAATQLHVTKPCELNDPSPRMYAVFSNPPRPVGSERFTYGVTDHGSQTCPDHRRSRLPLAPALARVPRAL